MTDNLDIHDPEPDEPGTADIVHQFLLERRAAANDQPAIQDLREAYDHHTAQDEFDHGRRTYLSMCDLFVLARGAGT
jgi:hypothetical protein